MEMTSHVELGDNPSRIWLPGIIERIGHYLGKNETACILRLVDKASASIFSDHKVVRLSQPSPADAFIRRWAAPGAMWSLTYKQRIKLLCLTAASGDLANLDVAVSIAGCALTGSIFEAAAGAGHLHICRWLREHGCRLEGGSLKAAAGGGHRAVCEWLLDAGFASQFGSRVCFDAMRAAASCGKWDLALVLRARCFGQEGLASYQEALLLADVAGGCDLATLQRLHTQWAERITGNAGWNAEARKDAGEFIISCATGSRTPDWQAKVEWLEQLGYTSSVLSSVGAAGAEDALPRLTWLRRRGYTFPPELLNEAAGHGKLAAVQYLLAEGVQPEQEAARSAAVFGHVAVLQALHVHGGKQLDPLDLLKCALLSGQVASVSWLLETFSAVLQPSAHSELLCAAAMSGNLELMVLLHERGCPVHDLAFSGAVKSGCEEAMEWLVQRGCQLPDDAKLYVNAAGKGDLATLGYLQRLGRPCASAGQHFASLLSDNAPLPALRWLVDNGCRPGSWADEGLDAAVERRGPGDREEARAWLRELREGQQQEPSGSGSGV